MIANDVAEGTIVFDRSTARHWVAFTPFMSYDRMWHCLSYEPYDEAKRILNDDNTLSLKGPTKVHGNLFHPMEADENWRFMPKE